MADVSVERERQRQRRLKRLAAVLGAITAYLWWRWLNGHSLLPALPSLPDDWGLWLPMVIFLFIILIVLLGPMLGNSRSPHLTYMPEQVEVGFSDVKGLGPVLTEVRHTLQVFLEYRKFQDRMGGKPRRGVLFEGPPGTGKTHIAKAMAKEAGVPFLFVSATAFQSMWYGMTARKIRSYFRQLRKVARREGGAIGFMEEIDAIATRRGGLSFSPLGRTPDSAAAEGNGGRRVETAMSEGVGGVVNELLVQMQSFDEPTRKLRFRNWVVGRINRFLPAHRQIKQLTAPPPNILLIAATNRADSLDPALLRPGRFDRILHFDLPGRVARRELVDYFLERKAHAPELEEDRPREDLAAATMGYSPASLERLFDEALLMALRDGRSALNNVDLRRAQMEVEIGLAQPTEYTAAERATIATHEAGHATVAYLVGEDRRLEVLSIIKRREALGLLAHRDKEERFTRRRSEMVTGIQISLGGMVAEELFFGESGTGPAGDLVAATNLAVEMVGSLGLGDSLISFRSLDGGLMGGNLASRVLADRRAREAVDVVLAENKERVTHLLTTHRHLVEALRDALLEREELIDDEILEVLYAAEAAAGDAPTTTVVDLREPSRTPAR